MLAPIEQAMLELVSLRLVQLENAQFKMGRLKLAHLMQVQLSLASFFQFFLAQLQTIVEEQLLNLAQ